MPNPFRKRGPYTGPVVFVDGWHHAVKPNGKHGGRVVSEGGGYRHARKGDVPHNDKHHRRFVELQMGGGQ